MTLEDVPPAEALPDPPGLGELPEVSPQEAALHAERVGDIAQQPEDHPYDPAGDPYAKLAAAGREGRTMSTTLDPEAPGAAPRAGG